MESTKEPQECRKLSERRNVTTTGSLLLLEDLWFGETQTGRSRDRDSPSKLGNPRPIDAPNTVLIEVMKPATERTAIAGLV